MADGVIFADSSLPSQMCPLTSISPFLESTISGWEEDLAPQWQRESCVLLLTDHSNFQWSQATNCKPFEYSAAQGQLG